MNLLKNRSTTAILLLSLITSLGFSFLPQRNPVFASGDCECNDRLIIIDDECDPGYTPECLPGKWWGIILPGCKCVEEENIFPDKGECTCQAPTQQGQNFLIDKCLSTQRRVCNSTPPMYCTCVDEEVRPTGPPAPEEIPTALGSIPTNPNELTNWIIASTIKLAGGIAFALLLYGGILFITAQGDEEKVEEAQKTITSALTGLLVIFFATLILKVIGYDVLGLPGWGWDSDNGLITPGEN